MEKFTYNPEDEEINEEVDEDQYETHVNENEESAQNDESNLPPTEEELIEKKLKDEMSSLQNVCDCLVTCSKVMINFCEHFSKANDFEGKSANELFLAITDDLQQAFECFVIGTTILAADPDPIRIRLLVFEGVTEYLPVLISFIGLKPPQSLAPQQAEMFNAIITRGVKALSKLISICSYESHKIYEDEVEESKRLAKVCAERLISENGLDALLVNLQEAEDPAIRMAVAETLFVFILRNDMGKFTMVVQRSVPILLRVLQKESIPVIKLHSCAILREFCTIYPEELLEENILPIIIELIQMETAPEVVVLAMETLEVIFRREQNSVTYLNKSLPALVDALLLITEKDQSEVLESVLRLFETIFLLKDNKFTEEFVEKAGWQQFIKIMGRGEIKVSSLAVRTLRILIQSCPYELKIGKRIVSNYRCLSLLLKAILDGVPENSQQQQQQSPLNSPKNPEEEAQDPSSQESASMSILKIEISLAFALIFAQSPQSRKRIREELGPFPIWLSNIYKSIKSNITQTSIEYFSEIPIVDCFGVDLIQSFLRHQELQKRSSQPIYQKSLINYLQENDQQSILFNHPQQNSAPKSNKPNNTNLLFEEFSISEYIFNNQELSKEDPRGEKKNGDNSGFDTPEVENAPQNPFSSTEKQVIHPFNSTTNEKSCLALLYFIISKTLTLPNSKQQAPQSSFFQTPNKQHQSPEQKPKSSSSKTHNSAIKLQPQPQQSKTPNNMKPEQPGNFSARSFSASKEKTGSKIAQLEKELKTFLTFSQYYHRAAQYSNQKQNNPFYNPANPSKQFVSAAYIMSPNPFISPGRTNSSQNSSNNSSKLVKSWSLEDVDPKSDVFRFAFAIESLTLQDFDQIIKKSKSYKLKIKEAFLTCPYNSKTRGKHSFLKDMESNMLPKFMELISNLRNVFERIGNDGISKWRLYFHTKLQDVYPEDDNNYYSMTHENLYYAYEITKGFLQEYHPPQPEEPEEEEKIEEFMNQKEEEEEEETLGTTGIKKSVFKIDLSKVKGETKQPIVEKQSKIAEIKSKIEEIKPKLEEIKPKIEETKPKIEEEEEESPNTEITSEMILSTNETENIPEIENSNNVSAQETSGTIEEPIVVSEPSEEESGLLVKKIKEKFLLHKTEEEIFQDIEGELSDSQEFSPQQSASPAKSPLKLYELMAKQQQEQKLAAKEAKTTDEEKLNESAEKEIEEKLKKMQKVKNMKLDEEFDEEFNIDEQKIENEEPEIEKEQQEKLEVPEASIPVQNASPKPKVLIPKLKLPMQEVEEEIILEEEI